ncbi:MAG: hypothetical protein V4819_23440 [Verrucomicrobiota bacterium]
MNTSADPPSAFQTMVDLRDAHTALLKSYHGAGSSPELIGELRDFIARARLLGTLLGMAEERVEAQRILDQWGTVLIKAESEPVVLESGLPAKTEVVDTTLNEYEGRDLSGVPSPYFGLRPFDKSESDKFFGRDGLRDRALEILDKERLLVALGCSGSGKSSLVRAGVLPALLQGKVRGSREWLYIGPIYPGSEPVQNLLAALPGSLAKIAPPDATKVQSQPGAFVEWLTLAFPKRIVVVLIDQFEEIFTMCERETRTVFASMLAGLLENKTTSHRVVLTMCDDFEPSLNSIKVLQKYVVDPAHILRVAPLTREELMEVIMRPANEVGLRIDPEVVDALLADVDGENAALPMLQFTLQALWDERVIEAGRDRISLADYHAIGGAKGVKGVLKHKADGFFEHKLVLGERPIARGILQRMVRIGEGAEVTRGRMLKSSLSTLPYPPEQVQGVIQKLVDSGLVRATPGAKPADEQIEVAHEAMIRNWDTFISWLEEDHEQLVTRRRLDDKAAEWVRLGRGKAGLLDNKQIAEAEDWLGSATAQKFGVHEALGELVKVSHRHQRRLVAFRYAALVSVIVLLVVVSLIQRERKWDEVKLAKDHAVMLNLERAQRSVEVGDPAGAFLYFQNALEKDSKPGKKALRGLVSPAKWREYLTGLNEELDSARKRLHELRLGVTWVQLPRLIQLFYRPGLGHSELSPDGRYLVGTSESGAVVWTCIEDSGPGTKTTEPKVLLDGLTRGQASWASFHPVQPLVAIAVAAPEVNGKPGRTGEMKVFDATTGKIVGKPILFPDRVPQKAWFAPGKVGDALMVISLPSDGRAKQTEFFGSDFNNIPRFFAKLETASDPLSGFLFSRISTQDQQVLKNANSSPEMLENALIGNLNRVIREGELYTEERFAGVTLGPDTEVLKERNPLGDDLVRLNRLLLEDAYPGDLRGVRGEVSMWNYRTGVSLAAPLRHSLPINWAGFSPDGKLVITAAGDLDTGEEGESEVWAWQTNCHTSLRHDGGAIAYVEFDTNGIRVVTAEGANNSSRGAARVWRVERRPDESTLQVTPMTAPLNHRGAVIRARFSPDGQWIATGSRDRTARIWHIDSQKAALSFQHNGDVNDVEFSPDGRFLATAGRDRVASVWEIGTGQRALPPLNHSETVNGVKFRPDGRRLLTYSKPIVRVWDVARREPNAPILPGDFELVAVSGNGQRVFTASAPIPTTKRRNLTVWDTKTGKSRELEEWSDQVKIFSATLDAEGRHLAIASRGPNEGTRLQVFEVDVADNSANDAGSFKELASLGDELNDREVAIEAFSGDGKRLALGLRQPGRKEGVVELWDWELKKLTILPSQEPCLLSQIRFSPSGDLLLACFTLPNMPKGHGRMWKVNGTAAIVAPEAIHETMITSAAFSPDEQWLLTGSTDDDARLWQVGKNDSGKVLATESDAHTHTADLTKVLFSPNGEQALTASKDQTAILWKLDGRGNALRDAVLQHSAYVNDASFKTDDNLILTSSDEPRLRVWSTVKTGELIAIFNPLESAVQAGFSPDGVNLFAIGQKFANRTTQARHGADQVNSQLPVYKVRPMMWSFKQLKMNSATTAAQNDDLDTLSLKQTKVVGQLIAARQVATSGLEKVATERPPQAGKDEKVEGSLQSDPWQGVRKSYKAQFQGERSAREKYHLKAAEESEATEQWFAAAWHFEQLEKKTAGRLNQLFGPKIDLPELLTRRADAYKKADNKLVNLPKCIADLQKLVNLDPKSEKDHTALAEVYLAYGAALPTSHSDPENPELDKMILQQWDLAIKELRDTDLSAPKNCILLGEALAGKRDFTQAYSELQREPAMQDRSAPGRRALVGWLSGKEEGIKEYQKQCSLLLDLKTDPLTAYSLQWPSVLTNEFEKDAAFCEELIRQGRAWVEAAPGNYFRRNNYGAALYRAGRYKEAIQELELARLDYAAERLDDLNRRYDQALRVPIERRSDGRPQDWLFLALANARLAEKGDVARRTEAWDWMRKAMAAPELAHVLRASRVQPPVGRNDLKQPVPYGVLGLEMLYYEVYDLLMKLSMKPSSN